MTNRSILRFADPTHDLRVKGSSRFPPQSRGPGPQRQKQRFQSSFDRLTAALNRADPAFALREDPNGIAPERALVFVTAGRIQRFAQVARQNGLEVLAETTLDATPDVPEGFSPHDDDSELSRTLYATMPTIDSLRRILALWTAYSSGKALPSIPRPWREMFDLLLELRTWGPEDRLTDSARTVIEDRLLHYESTETSLELEMWPTENLSKREEWREQTERWISESGGRVVSRSTISEVGFAYDAILVSLPNDIVATLLDRSDGIGGLATLEGIQFILPQTIAQTLPGESDNEPLPSSPIAGFAEDSPIRAVLLDGTPAAAHPMIKGGLEIEDVNDLVRLSLTNQRLHATGMASLILRGDLSVDGEPLHDTRIVSVPILVDADGCATSPDDRLFVDLVHSSLTNLLKGDEALTSDVFVVNFSVGIHDLNFAGRISSLSRLMDWWSATEGILFVISAGNVGELLLEGVNWLDFEELDLAERRKVVNAALRDKTFDRTLLAPAECLNGLCVGALSKDLADDSPPSVSSIMSLENGNDTFPQVSSALGLGPYRAIKPDLLEIGGKLEVRVIQQRENTTLQPVWGSRTGLVAASPSVDIDSTQKICGTSPAAALTTRAILQSAEALTAEGGPYEDMTLPRRTLSLITRALAVNSARWPDVAIQHKEDELQRLGSPEFHVQAKEEVCRHFGHGVIKPEMMRVSPDDGVTLIGHGNIRKDHAQVFRLPLPDVLSGERLQRSMRVTVSWFSPVDPAWASYRLAGLEVLPFDEAKNEVDSRWGLGLQTTGPDSNMVKRGTVWSCRLVNSTQRTPIFGERDSLPLHVQCRDTSGGGLSPDEDIPFALVVTLEVEADILFDVYQEIKSSLRLRVRSAI